MKIVEYSARKALRAVEWEYFLNQKCLSVFLSQKLKIDGAELQSVVDQVLIARPNILPSFKFSGMIIKNKHWVEVNKK